MKTKTANAWLAILMIATLLAPLALGVAAAALGDGTKTACIDSTGKLPGAVCDTIVEVK